MRKAILSAGIQIQNRRQEAKFSGRPENCRAFLATSTPTAVFSFPPFHITKDNCLLDDRAEVVKEWRAMALNVTFIGHATTLIQWDGLNVLTDPLFSSRVLIFKRKQPLRFDPATLPKLDAVLISHAHYDHLDLFSFKYIPADVPVFIPKGMSKAIAPFIKNPVMELSTWARFPVKPELEICAVPAKHPGGRFLIPYRYRTCHGYVVSHKGEHLYFAGDTAYGDHFEQIQATFPIKLALLPIANRHPNFISKRRHLNKQTFLKAWEDLGKPFCIPIHWGTFFRTWNNAAELKKDLGEEPGLHILEPGETIELPEAQPAQTSLQWPLRRVK